MRASRLLQILLLLQNRGRMTAARLAAELEVNRRTVLRDVDALTEAGLPIVTLPGQGGGIELGFNYRSRLTGLETDEAEAMELILSNLPDALIDLGLARAGQRAQAKLREAFPDRVRHTMADMHARFPVVPRPRAAPDPRRLALAQAVREARIVRLQTQGATTLVHPVALEIRPDGWVLICASGRRYDQSNWGRLNISARRFDPAATKPP